jgi:hypothetical protein
MKTSVGNINERMKIMNNLSFVLWMLGFPLVMSIDSYLSSIKRNKEENRKVDEWFSSIVTVAIWFYIGSLLYVK